MAGLLIAGISVLGSHGIEKVKTKRAAKQQARIDATQISRGPMNLAADEPGLSGRHGNRSSLDAPPPPYVKDAPTYDEHYRDARAVNGAGPVLEQHPALKNAKLIPHPGESEKQMKRRLRKEYFKKGEYWQLVGAGIANGC